MSSVCDVFYRDKGKKNKKKNKRDRVDGERGATMKFSKAYTLVSIDPDDGYGYDDDDDDDDVVLRLAGGLCARER